MSYPDYGFGSSAANGDYHERLYHSGGSSGGGSYKSSGSSGGTSDYKPIDFEQLRQDIEEEHRKKVRNRIIITIVLTIICQPVGYLVGLWFLWYTCIGGY